MAGVVIEFAGGPGSWVTRTYSAAKGQGAFLNGQPISVSRVKDVNLSLLVRGLPWSTFPPRILLVLGCFLADSPPTKSGDVCA